MYLQYIYNNNGEIYFYFKYCGSKLFYSGQKLTEIEDFLGNTQLLGLLLHVIVNKQQHNQSA